MAEVPNPRAVEQHWFMAYSRNQGAQMSKSPSGHTRDAGSAQNDLQKKTVSMESVAGTQKVGGCCFMGFWLGHSFVFYLSGKCTIQLHWSSSPCITQFLKCLFMTVDRYDKSWVKSVYSFYKPLVKAQHLLLSLITTNYSGHFSIYMDQGCWI